MTASDTSRAAHKLIRVIAEGGDTTERALRRRFTDTGELDVIGVSRGLKYLKRRGWAVKNDQPYDRKRPDLGCAWILTDDGFMRILEQDRRARERERDGKIHSPSSPHS